MNDNVPIIINEINKIFNTDYNIISFDDLQLNELVQLVYNTLFYLNAIPQLDVESNLNAAALAIVDALQSIKYSPPCKITGTELLEGLLQGKRAIIYSILFWLLSNQKRVEKRAYLAKFVQKVEVDPEVLRDPDVQMAYAKHESLIEEFWDSYAGYSNQKQCAQETEELQQDIDKILKDITKLQNHIEQQKCKIDKIPDKESFLEVAKAYCEQQNKSSKLHKQFEQEKEIVIQLESRVGELRENIRQQSLRQANLYSVQQIIDLVYAGKVIDEEKLPALSQDDFETVNMEIEKLNVETFSLQQELSEKEMETINELKYQLKVVDAQIAKRENILKECPSILFNEIQHERSLDEDEADLEKTDKALLSEIEVLKNTLIIIDQLEPTAVQNSLTDEATTELNDLDIFESDLQDTLLNSENLSEEFAEDIHEMLLLLPIYREEKLCYERKSSGSKETEQEVSALETNYEMNNAKIAKLQAEVDEKEELYVFMSEAMINAVEDNTYENPEIAALKKKLSAQEELKQLIVGNVHAMKKQKSEEEEQVNAVRAAIDLLKCKAAVHGSQNK